MLFRNQLLSTLLHEAQQAVPRDVRIDRMGRIVSGPDRGQYVFVMDDALHVGHFLVITASGQNLEQSHDTWLQNRAALEQHFATAHWVVDWLD